MLAVTQVGIHLARQRASSTTLIGGPAARPARLATALSPGLLGELAGQTGRE
jgi:hypothetical protein